MLYQIGWYRCLTGEFPRDQYICHSHSQIHYTTVPDHTSYLHKTAEILFYQSFSVISASFHQLSLSQLVKVIHCTKRVARSSIALAQRDIQALPLTQSKVSLTHGTSR